MKGENNGNCQNGQLGELHGFLESFICAVFDIIVESESTGQLSLLEQMASSLWAKSSTNIGRIQSLPPIKI